MRKILLAGCCLIGLAACGLAPQKNPQPALVLTDHALVDKIWDVNNQRFIDKAQFVEQVVQSEYLLLGETHDNPLHHRYQAELIDALAAKRHSAIVAFEMIDDKQGELLTDKALGSVDVLIATLNHVKATWDYERNYRGVFASALRAGFGIYPASLGREAIMTAARQGDEQLGDSTKSLLAAVKLPADQEAASRREIESSHCGMLPPAMVEPMMFTQRVKDAVMAERLLAHGDVDMRVLVAGSGHARADRGVPLFIKQKAPGAKIAAIAWAEVVPEATDAPAYASHWNSERLPFDYVWFTPRLERPDPCASLREHMQKKQNAKPAESSAAP